MKHTGFVYEAKPIPPYVSCMYTWPYMDSATRRTAPAPQLVLIAQSKWIANNPPVSCLALKTNDKLQLNVMHNDICAGLLSSL